MNGEYFLVERYESDVEEEGEAEQVFLSLTNRFLEERNTQGEVKMPCCFHDARIISWDNAITIILREYHHASYLSDHIILMYCHCSTDIGSACPPLLTDGFC